ncbi:hypothetical protein LCGC14_2144390 [marine sediment metagenome]|uniref:Uncharacterized protein n=1 Tax=marine sediment metagenome TaxID=412755 RepID=A0A0F9GTR4_9ZZZZ
MNEAKLVVKAMVFIFATIALLGIVSSVLAPAPQIPPCMEDVVLVGVGEFEHGLWTRYVCGPAVDDYCVNQVWLDNEDVLCIGMGKGF